MRVKDVANRKLKKIASAGQTLMSILIKVTFQEQLTQFMTRKQDYNLDFS
jgi:hypothetical protein